MKSSLEARAGAGDRKLAGVGQQYGEQLAAPNL